MKIDLEHIHHWMCAIRESKDPKRTLDAFWRGQINSKIWLIENLRPFVTDSVSVDIHGGWVGVLASLMFQSDLPIKSIRTIDIDPECELIARTMNKKEEILGQFTAITADMCNTRSDADVIINTSCEHISQFDYDMWLNDAFETSLFVLQSNNYDISEHIRIAKDLEEFIQQSHLKNVLWSGELELPLYKRFMIIGQK